MIILPIIYYILLVISPASLYPHIEYHLYLWAQYNQFQSNHSIAAQCYESLMKNNPPQHVFPGFLAFLEQTKEYEKIIQIMPTIRNSGKTNLELDIIYAHTLDRVGKSKEAGTLFIQLAEKNPHHTEVIYYAVQSHMRNQEIAQAFKLINTYLESPRNRTKQFIFYFLKAQLYSIAGNIEEALSFAEKTLQENPSFAQAWVLIAMINEQLGNYDQTLLAYTKALEIENNPLILQQLQKIQLQKSYRVEQKQQKLFEESSALFKAKNYTAAMKKIDECLELGHNDVYLLFKVELFFHLDLIPNAAKITLEQLGKTPTTNLWYKVAHTIARTKKFDSEKILAVLQNLEHKNPTLITPLLYQADICLRLNNIEKAQQCLTKALTLDPDKETKARIVYELAQIHFHKKEWDKVAHCLDVGLKYASSCGPLYNLAAYFYAHHGKDLQKAVEYNAQSLEIEPNNVHFLDTQAYIWYKQKSLDKAYEALSSLVEKNQHHYIFKHLAMIEKTRDNKGKAKDFVTKALECTPSECPKKLVYQQLINTLTE